MYHVRTLCDTHITAIYYIVPSVCSGNTVNCDSTWYLPTLTIEVVIRVMLMMKICYYCSRILD